jgi:hypothetical protein
MASLDRGDGITKVGLDAGFTSVDTPFYDSALRLELYGQYVTLSGFGIYGAIPLAHSFGDAPEPMPQPTTALGNLELGGLYVIDRPQSTWSWVFRLGLAVPTASDSADGVPTNFYATWPRLNDLALTVPNAYYLRFGISPLYHANKLFARVDIGIDIGSDDDDNADEIIRFNGGVGYDFGTVALSLELVNLYNLDEFGPDDNFANTTSITARFMLNKFQPFISLGTPLDNSRDSIPFFLSGGIVVAP